mgnify:CR=1 FL=1
METIQSIIKDIKEKVQDLEKLLETKFEDELGKTEEEYDENYPIGGSVQPHDIQREMELNK